MSNLDNESQHQPVTAEQQATPEPVTEVPPVDGEDMTGAFEDITAVPPVETPAPVEETAEEKIARLESENEQLRQQSGV